MSGERATEQGLYSKYKVHKDGEEVDDCFVLEPEDDRAARVALKAYAMATQNDELAADLFEAFDLERTPQEVWEANNEMFKYEPPEKPAEAWSHEEMQELFDRVINRRTQWFCGECSGRGPIRSLEKARDHVSSKHCRKLLDRYAPDEDELETATDGGHDPDQTKQREVQNHGLADFQEGER